MTCANVVRIQNKISREENEPHVLLIHMWLVVIFEAVKNVLHENYGRKTKCVGDGERHF